MASGKSKKGRGGSSRHSRREHPVEEVAGNQNSANRISSISSTQPGTSNASPPSVTRRSLPEQYPESSQHRMNPPQPSRFSPPSQNLGTNPVQSQSSGASRRNGNEVGHLQQPQSSVQRNLQMDTHHQQTEIDGTGSSSSEESEDSSDEEVQNEEGQMTLNQLLTMNGRDKFATRLSPTPGEGLWFTRDKEVLTARIAKMLQDKFDGCWYSWKKTPVEAQDRYFIHFANRYIWDPRLTTQVRDRFDAVCKSRLKGMVNYVKTTGKRPNWIRKSIWKKMVTYWKTEEAIKKSRTASQSRLSERGGIGPHKHVGGPKSNEQHRAEMSAKEGREVGVVEVFMKTHSKPDGTYVDERARQIAEAYQKNLEATQSQLSVDVSMASDGASNAPKLTTEQLDEIFLKSTTYDARGNPYGLGSLSHIHKKRKKTPEVLPIPNSSEIEDLRLKLNQTESKLAEQVDQNKAQLSFIMTYLKEKDPAAPDWIVTTNEAQTQNQNTTTTSSQENQEEETAN